MHSPHKQKNGKTLKKLAQQNPTVQRLRPAMSAPAPPDVVKHLQPCEGR